MVWGYTLEQHAAAHSNTLHTRLTHDDPTGWRRLIGCLKLQAIFRKTATNYRALSRKITYKDTASYGSLPPCWETLQHSATHVCSTLAAIYCQKDLQNVFITWSYTVMIQDGSLEEMAPHCTSLQLTATHCNTVFSFEIALYETRLQSATLCSPLQHSGSLQSTATQDSGLHSRRYQKSIVYNIRLRSSKISHIVNTL